MQLTEIIEKDSVEKVSETTNISIDNLNYLSNEEFEKLTRVKALGFLLIFEREYKDIDLSALRERVKLYFEEHKPADEQVVMVSKDHIEQGSFSFFKWFIVASLLGGAWYLYSQGKLNGVIQNVETKKDFFDDSKALESNSSLEDAKKVSIEKTREEIVIATPIAPTEKKITLTSEEANISTKVASESVQPLISRVSESEKSTESIVQEVVKSAEVVVEKTVEEVVSEIKEPEVVTSVAPISTITINPTRGKLWFGFINIDTKKRREFMKSSSTPFEIKDGRWLLVTGHGFVDIVSDLKTIEVADSKKHYFYIDSTEIRSLTTREFRNMNGRRGW